MTRIPAGQYKAPWKIIRLVYNPQKIQDPNFQPITRSADIDTAEQNGMFMQINPAAGGNPYEIETGNVLICPFVSPRA